MNPWRKKICLTCQQQKCLFNPKPLEEDDVWNDDNWNGDDWIGHNLNDHLWIVVGARFEIPKKSDNKTWKMLRNNRLGYGLNKQCSLYERSVVIMPTDTRYPFKVIYKCDSRNAEKKRHSLCCGAVRQYDDTGKEIGSTIIPWYNYPKD